MRAYLDPKMADSTPAQAPARAGGWCISDRMQEIDSCATAVSVAVEEQSSASAEISQNVASASDGAKIVVPVLGEVFGAEAETRHSAETSSRLRRLWKWPPAPCARKLKASYRALRADGEKAAQRTADSFSRHRPRRSSRQSAPVFNIMKTKNWRPPICAAAT